MNISAKITRPLTLTMMVVSLCGFWATSTYAYIGEDIGSNMYRDLDSRYDSLYTNLLKKQTTNITNRINKEISDALPSCKNMGGCFDTGKKFSIIELENIASGKADISIVKSHLRNWVLPSTKDFEVIIEKIKRLYVDIKSQTQDTQKNLGEISLIGLYTDGSLDNSSFDLAYDLEQIHKVIFSESIPYDGYENAASLGMVDYFGWLFWNASDSAGSSQGNSNTSSTNSGSTNTGSNAGSSGQGASNSSGVLSGCDPTDLTNLDNGLFTDIKDLESGSSGATWDIGTSNDSGIQPSGQTDGTTNSPSSPSRNRPRNNKLTDSFPCNTFFCIRVNMIIYQQKLLGGGRTYSLESIINENLKISDKFAASSSMTQTKMTKNFFELSFKNLNLASRLHLGVMVTSMPVPLLNVEKNPQDKLNKKSEDTPGAILKKTFEDRCLDWKQPNKLDISGTKNKTAIEQSAELSTTDFSDKQDSVISCSQWPASYNEIMNTKFRNEYYSSFNGDLLELRSFTSAIRQNLDNIISVIKLLYAKK